MSLALTTDLNNEIDSATWAQSVEDPSMQSKIEGGYVVSRAKYTRTPRRSWKFGWTETTDHFKAELEDFWDSVGGGSDMWTMIHKPDGTTITVRFTAKPTYQYMGIKNTHRWSMGVEVQEV